MISFFLVNIDLTILLSDKKLMDSILYLEPSSINKNKDTSFLKFLIS